MLLIGDVQATALQKEEQHHAQVAQSGSLLLLQGPSAANGQDSGAVPAQPEPVRVPQEPMSRDITAGLSIPEEVDELMREHIRFLYREGKVLPALLAAIFSILQTGHRCEGPIARSALMLEVTRSSGNAGSHEVRDMVSSVTEVAHGDPHMACHLWVLVFPIVWATLSEKKEQQIQLAKPIIALLSKEYHLKQAQHRPNVVQVICILRIYLSQT